MSEVNGHSNGHTAKNGGKFDKIREKMKEDPNYKIEDDDELWIKLQFIE